MGWNIDSVVRYFATAYRKKAGIPHTPIPEFQVKRLAEIAEEFPVDEADICSMIDEYFKTDFHMPVDYRFGHFSSDNVFEILYFAHIH